MGRREGLDRGVEPRHRYESIGFADLCIEVAETTATEHGDDRMRVVSGPGLDAVHLTTSWVISLIFAGSEDGKSHNGAEYTSWKDCYAVAYTLGNAVLELAGWTEAG